MIRPLMLCLLLAFAAPALADTTFVDLGSAAGGRVVYCGTELQATNFRIELGTFINGSDSTCDLWLRPIGDPEIERLGLVRLPFNPPPSQAEVDAVKAILARPRSQSEIRHGEVNANVGIAMTQLVQEYQQQHQRGAAAETAMDRTARLQALMPDRVRLYLESGEVDSVVVVNEYAWRVKWRDTGWERMEINSQPKPSLTTRRADKVKEANRILTALRNGEHVLIDRGFTHATTTPAQRKSFDEDLLALRSGNGTSTWFPARVRERFKAHTDLRTIVQGGNQ